MNRTLHATIITSGRTLLRQRGSAPALLVSAALLLSSMAVAHPERKATLPAVSPDGKRVAYVRSFGQDSSELHVVPLDSGDDRVLMRFGHDAGMPGWSHDGRRVTLSRSTRDSATLWSIGLDGRDPRLEARLLAKGLSWSHNGRKLAYAVGDWSRSRLTVNDVRGGHARALSDSGSAWFNIAWSPDERTLAVTRTDSTRDMQVWLVDVASGRSRRLTAFTETQGRPQWPAWSPDGKRIAVQAGLYDRDHPERNAADLWVVEVASGKATRLGTRDGTWMDEAPSWGADGRIAFQSSRTGVFEVWCVAADGSGARQVTK